MAKAPTKNEREAVTARGGELLALIAAAGDAGLMLTQEEGLEAVNAGYATVDTSVTEGSTAKVTLTDAGRAALTSDAGGDVAGSKFEIDTDVPLPSAPAKRGRTSAYPFEMLELNASFHVPLNGVKAETLLSKMQSSVSGARARFATDSGDTREVTVKTYQRDENGQFVKDAEGKRIVTGETTETRPVKTINRDFTPRIVGSDDPKGPGVRVWRTK